MAKGNRKMDGPPSTGFAKAPAAPLVVDRPIHPVRTTLLAEGHRFRVLSLRLAPGEATSLQSHLHRSEHWVVVEGTAEITVGVLSRLVVEGEAAHIPLGKPHRLDNPGRLPAVLIAVESGSYLADDDVIHHD
jgi:mannose-6-phosphate isomerase-like protein (cupin superfamily)